MTKKYTTLFFDLDGTLVDSGEGITKCAQHALRHFGIEVSNLNLLRPFVGPPLEDSFKDFYDFSDADAREAVEVYRERYFNKGVYEQKPYEGVFDFLAKLKNKGYKIAIATSKTQSQAEFVTQELFKEFRPLIDCVFARDDEGTRHTKADVIRFGLESLATSDKSKVLMIGDRKFDIIGAKECGLDAMGVLYGFGNRPEFIASGADYICSDFDEILNIL